MPTTMTLDGVRTTKFMSFLRNLGPRSLRGLGDILPSSAGSAPAPPSATGEAAADFLTSTIGWGILSFAISTLVLRSHRAVKDLRPWGGSSAE